jgi:hypothetical protein
MSERNQAASADMPPADAMLQIIAGARVARCVYIAATLGLADLLKDRPATSEELAKATGTHAPSLHRVMRMLASAGVFAEDEQGYFALTPLGVTLRTDVPGSLRAWVALQLGEAYEQAWGEVLHTMRTGEIAFDYVFGMGAWQYMAQHPEYAKLFDQAMANLTGVFTAAVLASYPFSVIDTVVDVGGGDGSLLVALLQAHPRMQGVLFELPQVAVKAKKRLAEAGVAERCAVVAGDAFAAVPGGGDAYILSRVIHDWDDDRAVVILKNCHRAMTGEGKLLLVEPVLPPRMAPSVADQTSAVFDLTMMVMTGGRERTVAEHRALVKAAGFELTKVIPTQSAVSVIECARA